MFALNVTPPAKNKVLHFFSDVFWMAPLGAQGVLFCLTLFSHPLFDKAKSIWHLIVLKNRNCMFTGKGNKC